jgi:hypothetical protein
MSNAQVLPSDDPLIRGQPALRCRLSRATLVKIIGEPHYPEQEGFGLGDYDLWAFVFPCGLKLMVTLLPWHTDDGGRNADDEPSHVWFHTNQPDPAHIRSHLRLLPELQRWSGDEPFPLPTWVVWRQDDNGIKDRVSTVTTRCEAERLRNEMEARGHKQLYWVETLSPDDVATLAT